MTELTIAQWKAALEGSWAAIDNEGFIWIDGSIFFRDACYPEFGYPDPEKPGYTVCEYPTPENVTRYAEQSFEEKERMHERGRQQVVNSQIKLWESLESKATGLPLTST